MDNNKHHIIFEGPELAGKSYLMSEVYKVIEPKYNSGDYILDGCHWFNLDVGLYGTPWGQKALRRYMELLEDIKDTNFLVEKFHITETAYQKLYNNIDFDYRDIEVRLKKMDTKLVLVTYDAEESLIRHRLEDRLRLYPHYSRIAQEPKGYIRQQELYLNLVKQSKLDYLIVNASQLPNPSLVDKILKFLGEK